MLGRVVHPSDLADDGDDAPGPPARVLSVGEGEAGGRLDRVIADLSGLSRARIQALMAEGALRRGGTVLADPSAKATLGAYELTVPPPRPAEPEPEPIPLTVLFEDGDLIVLDKPAGMAVHPSPGCETGTLVNALLHHCAGRLSGVGGVARPGVVHRLDKDTSGVMVAAKSDAAHQGLARLFAAHDLDREYLALTRGAPQPDRGVVETRIGRSPHDRKKMAVLKSGGREAVTRYAVEAAFGEAERPLAARVRCRLETGRTHQIRVHLSHKGSPLLGDPVYGSGPPAAKVRDAIAQAGLTRQALHAAVLGFVHPVTGEALRFETSPPEDMATLEAALRAL
jgi:23S rRNA pseudouridine1911/1915/1917 synthase